MFDTVEFILSCVLSLAKAFGVFPMKWKTTKNKIQYSFSKASFCYSSVIAFSTAALALFQLFNDSSNSKILSATIIEVLTTSFGILIWLVILNQNYSCSTAIVNLLDNIQSTGKQIGVTNYTRTNLIISILFAIAHLLQYGMFIFIDSRKEKLSLLTFIKFSDIFFYQAHLVFANVYAVITAIVSDQLEYINTELSSSTLRVRRLIYFHRSLCITAEKINRTFDVFLLTAITFAYITVVLKMYTLIAYVVKTETHNDIEMLLEVINTVIIHSSVLFIIVVGTENSIEKVSDDSISKEVGCARGGYLIFKFENYTQNVCHSL